MRFQVPWLPGCSWFIVTCTHPRVLLPLSSRGMLRAQTRSPICPVVSWEQVTTPHTQLSLCWHLRAGTHTPPFVGATLFATQQEFIFHGSPRACVSLALRLSHPEGGCLAGLAAAVKDDQLRSWCGQPSDLWVPHPWTQPTVHGKFWKKPKMIVSVWNMYRHFCLVLFLQQYSGTAIYTVLPLY